MINNIRRIREIVSAVSTSLLRDFRECSYIPKSHRLENFFDSVKEKTSHLVFNEISRFIDISFGENVEEGKIYINPIAGEENFKSGIDYFCFFAFYQGKKEDSFCIIHDYSRNIFFWSLENKGCFLGNRKFIYKISNLDLIFTDYYLNNCRITGCKELDLLHALYKGVKIDFENPSKYLKAAARLISQETGIALKEEKKLIFPSW